MIVEYDANLTPEEQVQSLRESVQRALDEISTAYMNDIITNSEKIHTTINVFEKDYEYFNRVTTDRLDAHDASIGNLQTDNVYVKGQITAHAASINDLIADYAQIDEKLVAAEADIGDLKAKDVEIEGNLSTTTADVDYLKANALTAATADLRYANITLANIDAANVNVAKIGTLFNAVGLIDRATIVDGHITGYLDAVEINAANITAGTLTTNRLLLAGTGQGNTSVLYELNNLGQLTSQNVNSLDGYVLTDRTINADKIIAHSITANEVDVNSLTASIVTASHVEALDLSTFDLHAWNANIGGFHIGEDALYSPAATYEWDPELDQTERGEMNTAFGLSEATGSWAYDDLTAAEMAALNTMYGLAEQTDMWGTTLSLPEYRLLFEMIDIHGDLDWSVYVGTDGLNLGNNFYVDINGNLEARNADITGHIHATSLTLGSDASVPYRQISGAPKLEVFIQKDGTLGKTPGDGATGFHVSSDGLLQASNAVIYGTVYASAGEFTGEIHAGSGDIGGWTIEQDYLYSGRAGTSNYALLSPEDGLRLGNDFSVDMSGYMKAEEGRIGNWEIYRGALMYKDTSGENIYLDEDGLSFYDENDNRVANYNSDGLGIFRGSDQDVLFNVYADGGLFCQPNRGSSIFNVDRYGSSMTYGAHNVQVTNSEAVLAYNSTRFVSANSSDVYICGGSGGAAHISVGTNVVDITSATAEVQLEAGGLRLVTGRSATNRRGNLFISQTGLAYYASEGTSSREVKKDIAEVSDELLRPERLYDVDVVQFRYREDFLDDDDGNRGKLLPGFIIEDLDKVYPAAVSKEDPDEPKTWEWSDVRIIPPMLKLIQDQHKEIETLKEEMQRIRKEMIQ